MKSHSKAKWPLDVPTSMGTSSKPGHFPYLPTQWKYSLLTSLTLESVNKNNDWNLTALGNGKFTPHCQPQLNTLSFWKILPHTPTLNSFPIPPDSFALSQPLYSSREYSLTLSPNIWVGFPYHVLPSSLVTIRMIFILLFAVTQSHVNLSFSSRF